MAVLDFSICYSQNIKEDFKNINDTYFKLKNTYIEAKMKLYTDYISTKPIEESTSIIKRSGNYYYTKQGNSEYLRNKFYQVIIDNNNKVIILDSSRLQLIQNPYLSIIPLDSLLSILKQTTYREVGNNKAIYTIVTDFDYISKFEVQFNKKSYFIEKLVFYINTTEQGVNGLEKLKPRIEIVYQKFRTDAKYNDNEFSESRYFSVKGKKVILTQAYTGYTLHNHLFD
jgi:hypothetical protein